MFKENIKYYSKPKEVNRMNILNKIDWNFKGEETQYLTHKYHSYPARFIPQIPKNVINSFLESSNKNDIILDPFCGCGTTCVEARLAKKNTMGIDINPLAVLITKAKSTPIEPLIFNMNTKNLFNIIEDNFSNIRDIFPEHLLKPSKENGDYFKKSNEYKRYLEEGIKEVKINIEFFRAINALLKSIEALKLNEDEKVFRNYCLVALSSTINTLSKNNVNKKDIIYPIEIFKNHLKNMNIQMEEFYEKTNKENFSKIFEDNSWDLRKYINDSSIDLIVTSPPYANAFDYHREHKLNILWLGLEYRNFKDHEMGAHSLFTGNRFRMLSEYLSDMLSSIAEMSRVLKQGKICCIVIGNSTVEHVLIETHEYFKMFGNLVGLKPKHEILRNIDTTKKYTSRGIGNIDKEYLIFFEKNDYKKPSKELIIDSIKSILEKLLERHKKDEVLFDEATLKKTLNRKTYKKTLGEIKETNMEKLREAINKAGKDCFLYRNSI